MSKIFCFCYQLLEFTTKKIVEQHFPYPLEYHDLMIYDCKQCPNPTSSSFPTKHMNKFQFHS